jgi:predicted Zn-dependent protease
MKFQAMILQLNLLILIAVCLILFPVHPATYSGLLQLAEASSGHHGHFSHSNNNNFSPRSPSIAVCCAWDNKFANGQLTYMIVGGDAPSRQAVVESINEWTSSVDGLQFTQVSDKNSADIVVNFQNVGRNGGGSVGDTSHSNGLGSIRGSTHTDIVGETILHGSSNGLIDGAQINIATAAFGSVFGTAQIKQIAMHEIGHALGIGHANFIGDIMAPAINYEKVAISRCDVNAVLSANQWKLEGSNTTPEPPQADHVEC